MLKAVFAVTVGVVAGQVCGGRTPLVGRLGNRLLCTGPRGVTCPSNSICEVPSGFCCPAVTVTTTLVAPVVPVTTIITPVTTVITPVTTVITPVVSKCQVGSPFKDALGYDIDCSKATCPAGSECIVGPNNIFHSCCAIVPTTVVTTTTVLPVEIATCDVGLPLTDSAGVALQCGSLLPDCPLGSSCISVPPNGAPTCCPLPVTVVAPVTASPTTSPTTAPTVAPTATLIAMGPVPAMAIMSTDNPAWATVRYLNIRLLNLTQAIAMWAPPSDINPSSYLAEISYDGSQWRSLSLEQPASTFVVFTVSQSTSFWVRVTPLFSIGGIISRGAPASQAWNLPGGKGKAGKTSRG